MLRKALAAYRLTHLFVYEDGPFGIFDWFRSKVGITVRTKEVMVTDNETWTTDIVLQDVVHAEGFWAELLTCPLCLSVWFAAVVHFLPDSILDWLSIAGICLLLFKRVE